MRLVIVGAGDHGRVLADLARACDHEPIGFVQPGHADARSVDGLPIIGSLDDPAVWMTPGLGFTVGLGDNRERAAAFDRCLALGLAARSLVHPRAVVLGGAEIADGAQVCAGAVIGLAARIGPDVIVNTGATIDHDDVLDAHAFVGPGAHLAGNVTVEAGAHVGLGALVREGTRIGAWSYVAAGGVVIHDVPPSVRVAGVPARPMEGGLPPRTKA
jgi:sugar O-acyltransferase (sialic acid O-acetyltransferase NeuD family)